MAKLQQSLGCQNIQLRNYVAGKDLWYKQTPNRAERLMSRLEKLK